jgi:hypothetical protein
MTQPLNLGNCCGPSITGLRRITFPDGDQVGIIGLDAIMEALYKEGKLPDDSAAMEIISRLRNEGKNYISYNSKIEEQYQKVLLNEYRRFFEKRAS